MRHPTVVIACCALLGCAGASTREEPLEGADANDAPEISRSVGRKGGGVIFWPRVVPRNPDTSDLAGKVQAQLTEAAREAGVAPLDVRPEPERVCPRAGCAAMTVGAALMDIGGGCAVVGLVAEPGQAPTTIVPWVGEVKTERTQVPFREPPESDVTIVDATPCEEVAGELGADDDLVAAIREVAQ